MQIQQLEMNSFLSYTLKYKTINYFFNARPHKDRTRVLMQICVYIYVQIVILL